MAPPVELLLASASPRRAAILRDAGIAFRAVAANVDESILDGEAPREYVLRLSAEKAQAVAAKAEGEALIMGADTIVVCEKEIFGKPDDAAQARRMLGRLSGRAHEVLTGVTLLRRPGSRRISFVETTRVTFSLLSPSEVEAYVATGEPLGKAGAYAIQGLAARFVTDIEGDYFNVVGLPLQRILQVLPQLDWQDAGTHPRHGSGDAETIR